MQQGIHPNGFQLVNVRVMCRFESIGFLYLEIEVVCVEFGCHFEVELEYEKHLVFMMRELVVVWHDEVALSTFDVLQRFGFFLQMGFILNLATLDGLDVGLLGDIIGEDDCDDDG
ncbi:hypothetical protein Tco_0563596 [Tanacetum coccineum]